MSMLKAKVTITGTAPLLQNNPQTVDRFNEFSKKMAKINAKKTRRTDDDYLELREIEIRSKIYFSKQIGIFVPESWLTAATAATAFRVGKISKADVRGALFATEAEIKLNFLGMDKIKTEEDVVMNPAFRTLLTLKQGQVRVVKAFPIFREWNFSTVVEFDDKIIDPDTLTNIVEHTAKYGGFGDFRPKFGRARAVVTHG